MQRPSADPLSSMNICRRRDHLQAAGRSSGQRTGANPVALRYGCPIRTPLTQDRVQVSMEAVGPRSYPHALTLGNRSDGRTYHCQCRVHSLELECTYNFPQRLRCRGVWRVSRSSLILVRQMDACRVETVRGMRCLDEVTVTGRYAPSQIWLSQVCENAISLGGWSGVRAHTFPLSFQTKHHRFGMLSIRLHPVPW